MVSSGIVLMPFNIIRYSLILSIGLILFISGSIFNEIVINQQHLSIEESVKLIIISLTLAIGIGMISGGISHFKESPVYVSYLIPIGIIISFISFTIKNNYKLNKKEKIVLLFVLIFIAFTIHFLIGALTGYLIPTPTHGGDIFKPMSDMPSH